VVLVLVLVQNRAGSNARAPRPRGTCLADVIIVGPAARSQIGEIFKLPPHVASNIHAPAIAGNESVLRPAIQAPIGTRRQLSNPSLQPARSSPITRRPAMQSSRSCAAGAAPGQAPWPAGHVASASGGWRHLHLGAARSIRPCSATTAPPAPMPPRHSRVSQPIARPAPPGAPGPLLTRPDLPPPAGARRRRCSPARCQQARRAEARPAGAALCTHPHLACSLQRPLPATPMGNGGQAAGGGGPTSGTCRRPLARASPSGCTCPGRQRQQLRPPALLTPRPLPAARRAGAPGRQAPRGPAAVPLPPGRGRQAGGAQLPLPAALPCTRLPPPPLPCLACRRRRRRHRRLCLACLPRPPRRPPDAPVCPPPPPCASRRRRRWWAAR
jgi:hypothetical protein